MSDIIHHFFRALFALTVLLAVSCSESGDGRVDYDLYEVHVKSTLNVRSGPYSDSPVVSTLNDGDKVKVVSIDGGWAKIECGSSYAYVSSDYLQPVPGADAIADGNVSGIENTIFLLYDNAGIFSDNEAKAINQKFAAAGANVVLWTVDSVEKDKILDYNRQTRKSLKKDSRYSEEVKRLKSYGIKRREIYHITYIDNVGLMQVHSDAKAMKIINYKMPDKFFEVQSTAMEYGPGDALAGLSSLITDAYAVGNEMNWFARKIYYNSSSFGDLLTSVLAENIVLPSGSFMYRYLFSWILALPEMLVSFLVTKSGSMQVSFLLLCILTAILLIARSTIANKLEKTHLALKTLIALPVLFILYLTFFGSIIIVMYSLCDMTGIVLMDLYGKNPEVINVLYHDLGSPGMAKPWWMLLAFSVGTIVYEMPAPLIFVLSLLPDAKQQAIAQNQKHLFVQHNDLISEPSPFSQLLTVKAGGAVGYSVFLIILCLLIFNGTIIFYATVLSWALLVPKVYSVFLIYSIFKSKGLLNK